MKRFLIGLTVMVMLLTMLPRHAFGIENADPNPGDRIAIDEGTARECALLHEDTDVVTVLGRNKLNIYHGKKVYQLKGGKRFNALKYVHIYYRYRNIARGDTDGKFLGL
jgi:hypothetical protein